MKTLLRQVMWKEHSQPFDFIYGISYSDVVDTNNRPIKKGPPKTAK
jgi:hypothetical protein